jgi:hypothetical protein
LSSSGSQEIYNIDESLYFTLSNELCKYDLDRLLNENKVESIFTLEKDKYDYIRSFVMDETVIYYCTYSRELGDFVIFKCDVDGNNQTIIKEKTGWAEKMNLYNGNLLYSTMTNVVMLANGSETLYLENYVVPMPGGKAGTHFIIGDTLILSNYFAPQGYEKFGCNPTIVMDFEGNVIAVWENTVVNHIAEADGKIYAQIDMKSEAGYSTEASGVFVISNDFKDKKLVIEDIKYSDFTYFYIKGNMLHFMNRAGVWSTRVLGQQEPFPGAGYFNERSVKRWRLLAYIHILRSMFPR